MRRHQLQVGYRRECPSIPVEIRLPSLQFVGYFTVMGVGIAWMLVPSRPYDDEPTSCFPELGLRSSSTDVTGTAAPSIAALAVAMSIGGAARLRKLSFETRTPMES